MEEFKERAELIEQILDKLKPFHPKMPEKIRDAVDSERQMLAMRAGWTTMPIEELRRVAAGRR